jgi:hypothetical protein
MINTLKLDLNMIEGSKEIQAWLDQLGDANRLSAISLLCNLNFITRDGYSNWLLNKLENYTDKQPCAIYAVRKFEETPQSLWQGNGDVQYRPATAQGSEDLIASLIANAKKQYKDVFLDHPGLNELREHKVKNILLIDDSIGSGKRVADFIKLMTNNATFLSWWSFGFLKIYVLSYARTRQAEQFIYSNIPSTDYANRKYKLSDKLKFDSDIYYDAYCMSKRWGYSYSEILKLCEKTTQIKIKYRKGFGDIMGNIIFYHSVPNNIPGMLFINNKGWQSLFDNRSCPQWLISLLENKRTIASPSKYIKTIELLIPKQAYQMLLMIKKGIRTKPSLSRRLDVDVIVISQLIESCIQSGLLSAKLRLTNIGFEYLINRRENNKNKIIPDYSLFIPDFWCVGRVTVQPSVLDDRKAEVHTDSVEFISMDGDGGESSLERTDAKATSSPICVITHKPSTTQMCNDTCGPVGLKE